MTTAIKTRKATAANTPALARVKKMFNAQVYKKALTAWNEQGEAAAREYIGTWFNDEYRERRLAELFG